MALGGLTNMGLRMGSLVCYIFTFISAIIVTAVVGNLLQKFSNRNAVITMVVYLVGAIAPCLPKYGGILAPLHLVFSYLWLVAFVFASLSWSHNRCRNSFPAPGNCSKKHAIQAWLFIGFFFILCNLLIEVFLIRAHRRNAVNEPRHHHHTKERPDSTISGETGTTAPPPVAGTGTHHMGGQHMGGQQLGTQQMGGEHMGTQQTHMAAPTTTAAV
ncbi:hypothetical protein TGAM01_v205821 [Trichoderma gamsii]|uniref:MARVEL domain-containing protein n=1 Tax=Trichoderma gamsii TaxID=398673 RepID=A0A2P4ZLK7_9HYPO|nr:hypothetical protein TGAM01_v205821 [Trichoderma gamsii]PON25135.1 hypothetical protein TGAM01_v205821 [Trichoderma gamsii]